MASVRLGFVGGLKRIVYHLIEQSAKLLRGGKGHAKSAGDRRDCVVIGVNRSGGQPEINNSINGSSFTDQINEVNRRFLST